METLPRRTTHIPSIFQLLLSGFGILVCGLAAVLLFAASLFSSTTAGATLNSNFLLSAAWVAILIIVLLLPSDGLCHCPTGRPDLPGHHHQESLPHGRCRVGTLARCFDCRQRFVRFAAGQHLLPFLQLLAVGLPIWWLLETGQRGLSTGSPNAPGAWPASAFWCPH